MNRFGLGSGLNILGLSKIERLEGGEVLGLVAVGWNRVSWFGLGWPGLMTARLDSV